ncbi:hypothetical protein ACFLTV_00265 [Chloroflexota bacterium]
MKIGYLRVTGGEPILNEKRLYHLLELFRLINENISQDELHDMWKPRNSPRNLLGRRNIKIQTNGVILSKLLSSCMRDVNNLRNICLTIEVSLKGTNPIEFGVLSGGMPVELFHEQLRVIEQLITSEKDGYPIFVRAIIGIFHSEQYDLVTPNSRERMMLNPSSEFRRIIEVIGNMPRPQERLYVEPLRFTDQMVGAEILCKSLGIITTSEIGNKISPGKKIHLRKTYLNRLVKI